MNLHLFRGPFTVSITAVKATQLPKKDTFGKIDAYVKLEHSGGTFQTEVIKKDYNPSWNHQFPPMVLGPKDKFTLSIWDWDKATAHDKVWKKKYTVGKLVSKFGPPVLENSSLVFPNATFNVDVQGHLYLHAVVTFPYSIGPAELNDFLVYGKLAHKLLKMKTHDVFYEDLFSLRRFDILMICDDSGSMLNPSDEGTRWSELKHTVKSVVSIAASLDADGIDVLFLNRPGASQVRSVKEVERLFGGLPVGGTDLAGALRSAYSHKGPKPLLILLATDGVPNSLVDFTSALESMPADTYLSVLACSDQDSEIGYLAELDAKIARMDVLDDFKSEREEVWKAMGQVEYTKGDHVARMLLGPVFPKYDRLDEFKNGIAQPLATW
jgi:hypothetical protein